MTDAFEAMSFFCEDIREEKSGQDSVIGFMPDNIALVSMPATIARMALYTRLRIGNSFDIRPISITIKIDEEEIFLTAIEDSLLHDTKNEMRMNAMPFGQIISRARFNGFQVLNPGLAQVIAQTDRFQTVCGAVRFRLSEAS